MFCYSSCNVENLLRDAGREYEFIYLNTFIGIIYLLIQLYILNSKHNFIFLYNIVRYRYDQKKKKNN